MEINNLRKMRIKLTNEEKESLELVSDIINVIAHELDNNFFDGITVKDENNNEYYFDIEELGQIINSLNILGTGILTAESGVEDNEY